MPITINGVSTPVPDDPRVSLLDLLREHLHLSGAKKGCNQGACGACTVLLDGHERILSCLALAVQFEGRSITSIEGLATTDGLHPLQQKFVDHDGFQCGYCTPGQICSAVGMAAEWQRGVPSHVTEDLAADTIALTPDELRERMSGNLCRCGAYNGIVAAITEEYAGGHAAEKAVPRDERPATHHGEPHGKQPVEQRATEYAEGTS
jgi:xanthine dehydrogenase YagT iron-sulfur-binding subunit